MDIKLDVSLQTKQVLSQIQMQSLNILTMSMTELQEFLQEEEIENPLIEYSASRQESVVPVTHREYERFYNHSSNDEDREHDFYEGEIGRQSLEDMVSTQLSLNQLGGKEKKIVEFCINSLDRDGFLTLTASEIAKMLGECIELVEQVLSDLKKLEPRGIFASGLEECLILQIQEMEQNVLLEKIIKDHLKHVSEGKISSISRALKVSSAEVRKLIRIIKQLNPRPLNGYGEERAQYILPDIICEYQDGQWTIGLNDRWIGTISINDFYVRMMESAQDEELKVYFEEKLRRARFIMNAVDQRKKTLLGISEEILKRQAGYLLGKEPLKIMTLEEIANVQGVHKSTVSRAIRNKYILAPIGCLLIRKLFTTGISSGDENREDISWNTVKLKLKELVDGEDKKKPYSDEVLVRLLEKDGMSISRRTVAKYRTEMGIGGTFQRKEE